MGIHGSSPRIIASWRWPPGLPRGRFLPSPSSFPPSFPSPPSSSSSLPPPPFVSVCRGTRLPLGDTGGYGLPMSRNCFAGALFVGVLPLLALCRQPQVGAAFSPAAPGRGLAHRLAFSPTSLAIFWPSVEWLGTGRGRLRARLYPKGLTNENGELCANALKA